MPDNIANKAPGLHAFDDIIVKLLRAITGRAKSGNTSSKAPCMDLLDNFNVTFLPGYNQQRAWGFQVKYNNVSIHATSHKLAIWEFGGGSPIQYQ